MIDLVQRKEMHDIGSHVIRLPQYDVVVAGGGPAGTAAAIAAARQGLSVLLLEATGCAGGTSTSGALPFYLGYLFRKRRRRN